MKVVIAEKPSVGRDLAKFLGATTSKDGYLEGNGYQVTWAIGHIVSPADTDAYGIEKWSLDNLPIIPDPFKYQVSSDKKKQFKTIKDLFSTADEIIVATDAGREGELIFRYIYLLTGSKKPFKRLWISSLTDEAIGQGFKNLLDGKSKDNLYYSARCRSEADWLVGINGTQALTLTSGIGSVLSVGRVQTPVLAMLCARYLDNKNFVATPYYEIFVKTEKTKIQFKATHPKRFEDQNIAKETLSKLSTSLQVDKYETKEKKEATPRLFDLSTLQQEANKKYGLSADSTLGAAQELYEKKFLTYPRTGSQFLSSDMQQEIPKLLSMLKKGSYASFAESIEKKPLPSAPFNNEKVTDHHAIIPTPIALSGEVSKSATQIYDLVVKRFLAAFSDSCIKDVTSITLSSAGIDFTASGNVIKSQGWRALYLKEETDKDSDESQEEDEQNLPVLSLGETLPILEKNSIQKFTKPKPIHTESSLLKLMETAGKEIEDPELADTLKECGIGTPATRASIIETLLTRDYITRSKKQLIPTEKGLQVYHLLKDKAIAKVELTGQWEKMLNLMADGKYMPNDFINEIKQYTKQLTSELQAVKVESKKANCPRCNQPTFAILDSFCKCSSCNFSIGKSILGKKLSDQDINDLISKRKTKLIKGFTSSSNKKFDAELILNENFEVKFSFPSSSNTSSSTSSSESSDLLKLPCPKCKSELSINSKMISCAKCDFKFWRLIAKKEISEAQIIKLIKTGKTDEIKGFISKSDKSFSASLKFKEDFSVEFLFSK